MKRERTTAERVRLGVLGAIGVLVAQTGFLGGQESDGIRPDLQRIQEWLASGNPDQTAVARRELGDRIGLEAIAALNEYLASQLPDRVRGPLLVRLHELARTRLAEVEDSIETFQAARALARTLGAELDSAEVPDPDLAEETAVRRRGRNQARSSVEEGQRELHSLGLALAPVLFHHLEAGGVGSPLVERFHQRLWIELEEEARRLFPHAPADDAINPHESRSLVPLIGSLEDGDPVGWERRRRAVIDDALARIESLAPTAVDEGRALLLELGDSAAPRIAAWVERDGPLPRELRERVAEWNRLRVPPGFERRTAIDLGRYGSIPRAERKALIHRLEFVLRAESPAVLFGIVQAEDDVALKVEAAAVLSRLGDPRGASFLGELGFQQALEFEEISRRVLLIEALQRRDAGDGEGALEALLALDLRFPGDFRLHYEIGFTALKLRRLELSIDHFERALALDSRDPSTRYNLACALALAGRFAEALDALELSVQGGYRDGTHIREDDDLEALRDDPRFEQILEGL